MRGLALIAASSLLVVCPAVFAQEGAPAANEEVLKEVRELRKAVDELTKKVDALAAEQEAKKPDQEAAEEAELRGSHTPEEFTSRGPDRKALREIELPENATKEQVREYISKIAAASRNQNTFSSDDPQVNMLTQVGPENIDLLIEAARRSPHADMYFNEAIIKLAREEDKQQVLKALPYAHQLVRVVLSRGWEEDAKDALLAELRRGPQYLPTAWIEAVANLRDPNTYQDLKNFLINGGNRHSTYEAIKDLPGIDLTDAIAKAWRASKAEGGWEAAYMAPAALEYGHKDALELVVNSLGKGERDPGYVREARLLMMRYTDARGSNEQIRKWFEANKDKLVFDRDARKYRVQEAK